MGSLEDYAHIGDGNLHFNVMQNDVDNETWKSRLDLALPKIYTVAGNLGGTVSGEHGIGKTQSAYLPYTLSPTLLNLMRDIKNLIDPNCILNRGVFFE